MSMLNLGFFIHLHAATYAGQLSSSWGTLNKKTKISSGLLPRWREGKGAQNWSLKQKLGRCFWEGQYRSLREFRRVYDYLFHSVSRVHLA